MIDLVTDLESIGRLDLGLNGLFRENMLELVGFEDVVRLFLIYILG
jgi:hypothetical protein